jgi:hypothetical protein
MESSRSIPELKSSFIRTQVRILSEALEAPEDWRSYAAEPAEEALSDKVVGDVLQKCKRNNVSVLAAPIDFYAYELHRRSAALNSIPRLANQLPLRQ